MAERHTIRAELPAAARKAIAQLCEQSGMTQVSLISRMIEWFAEQPAEMRWLILSKDDELRRKAAEELFRQLGGDTDGKGDPKA